MDAVFSESLPDQWLTAARPRFASSLEERVTRLFEELRLDVYRYLLTLGLHPPQAQEAAQEVFLRLYQALRGNEEIQNPRAWVFRVAHNLGLKIRAQQHAHSWFDPELEARLASPAVTPERNMIDRERALRFERAMRNLSEQQQRCLSLRLEGLKYPEIGAAMGISASAVGEFIRRAIARLKRAANE